MTETLNEAEQPAEPEAEPVEGDPVETDEPGVSDDEAAEAEDDEQAAPPELEPEPEPASLVNDVAMEAVFEKAGKRAKTYMSAIPDILGEAAQDLSLCPRCTDFLPGWILPSQIKPVSDEQRIAVKMSIGELVEPDYKQDTHASSCPDCEGRGKVATGSQVPSQRTATCLSCEGRGWIGPRSARAGASPPPVAAANGAQVEQAEQGQPVQDPWGRLIDDPLYGVMPGFERA